MRKALICIAIILVGFLVTVSTQAQKKKNDAVSEATPYGWSEQQRYTERERVDLAIPLTIGRISLEETLRQRRSVREFGDRDVNIVELAQLLWAGQGITDEKNGKRTAPSAGAIYPMELYVFNKHGVYVYDPGEHQLANIEKEDRRKALSEAAFNQQWVQKAPVTIVIAGDLNKTAKRYGREDAIRFVYIEAGHIAQNLQLQAVAMDLVSVPVGSIDYKKISSVAKFQSRPVYMVCVGKPAEQEE